MISEKKVKIDLRSYYLFIHSLDLIFFLNQIYFFKNFNYTNSWKKALFKTETSNQFFIMQTWPQTCDLLINNECTLFLKWILIIYICKWIRLKNRLRLFYRHSLSSTTFSLQVLVISVSMQHCASLITVNTSWWFWLVGSCPVTWWHHNIQLMAILWL